MAQDPSCPLCSGSLSKEPDAWLHTGGPSVQCYASAWVCQDCGACWPIRITADEVVSKLSTPEECSVFEKSVTEQGRTALAVAARKRAIAIRAEQHDIEDAIERECLEAVYAYERILFAKRGKKVRAARTWQMIKRHGIIGAVERAVNRKLETSGYRALVEMGLEEYAFEAVILRHPSTFSSQAVERAKSRLTSLKQDK